MKIITHFARARARFRLMLLASVAAALSAAPAAADVLKLSFSPLGDVAAGSTGNGFDVLLTNTSGPPVAIGGFFFDIQTSSSAVTFDAASTGTATPYVFGSDSLFGPNILGPGSTPQEVRASDLDAVDGISLAPDATVSLGHILFSVSATASTQLVNFSYAGFPATSLADDLGNNVSVDTLAQGQFTVRAVPLPSTLTLFLVGIPMLLILERTRKRATRGLL